ncbi:uncharacterized protein DEA37_0014219 [Paragonimus westermani]|uniref:Uncharacterized protein n=1 Tax=Paragonimus westermani TaxID=34504 RepID=A0A5J4N6F7_9TREM|nr:uncharacterized protein DEA37_0014219 [Paragonimus westermani]
MARALSGISVSLLALAVGTAIAALASDRWGCGGLFTGCQNSQWKAVASGVAGLMIAGSACLTAVLIMDLLTLCNEDIALRPGFGVARIVFLAIGTVTLLVAVLVYTAERSDYSVGCYDDHFCSLRQKFCGITATPHSGFSVRLTESIRATLL